MKYFFCFFSLLAALLADLLTGNTGFPVSFTAGVLLYFAGSCGIKTALILAVFAGMGLDMSYARPETFSAIILPLAISAGSYFMPSKEYRFVLLRSLPAGAVTSCVYVTGTVTAVGILYGKSGYPAGIAAMISGSLLFGAITYPLIVLLLDAIAVKLNLPGYLTKLPADLEKLEHPELPIETATGRRRRK
jgi:hypothetical protein